MPQELLEDQDTWSISAIRFLRQHSHDVASYRAPSTTCICWLSQFRRRRVRYDKRADIHEAFLSLGCALICWQSLRRTWRIV